MSERVPASSVEVARAAGQGRRALLGWFADRPVGTKILSTVLAVAAAALAVGLLSVSKLGAMQQSGTLMFQDNLLPLRDLANARMEAMQARLDVQNYVTAADGAERDKYAAAIRDDDQRLDAALARYRRTPPPRTWSASSSSSGQPTDRSATSGCCPRSPVGTWPATGRSGRRRSPR